MSSAYYLIAQRGSQYVATIETFGRLPIELSKRVDTLCDAHRCRALTVRDYDEQLTVDETLELARLSSNPKLLDKRLDDERRNLAHVETFLLDDETYRICCAATVALEIALEAKRRAD